MRDDDVRAHFKIFMISVPHVGGGQGGEFLAAVGDHHAPAALSLYIYDVLLNGIHIRPAQAPGLFLARGAAGALIPHAEYTDPAGLVENHRLLRLGDIHARADRFHAVPAGDLKGARHALRPRVHDVVVVDVPDVRAHLFQYPDRGGIDGMQKLLRAGADRVLRFGDNRPLHVGDHMVRRMQEIKNFT